jgi:hypothetical protein
VQSSKRVAPTEAFTMTAPARVLFTVGPLQGREFPLGPGLMIGRDEGLAQVVVQDPQVSGRHVWIGPMNGRYVARDQQSTNGTFHERTGQRVGELALDEGDVLVLGGKGSVKLQFRST